MPETNLEDQISAPELSENQKYVNEKKLLSLKSEFGILLSNNKLWIEN